MKNAKHPIFCLEKHESITEFSEMIDWAHNNKNSKTVLFLSEKEIYYYQDKGLWELISEVTQNWLFGPGEDDWIIDYEEMNMVRHSLANSKFIDDDNVKKIIYILDYAIAHHQSVVFYL